MKHLIIILFILVFFQCSSDKNQISSNMLPLLSKENLMWVKENLDSVMRKKIYAASNGMNMPYRLFIPSKYDETKKLPLLIHLHGRGERGTNNTSKIYNNIPLFTGVNSIVSPNGQSQYPCIVLVPQCSDKSINEEWAKWVGNSPETPWEGLEEDGSYQMAKKPSESGFAALELIDKLIDQYNIDKNRVYLTGLSMGGFGTWEFVGRRPELFAAIVPMAGYSDPTIVNSIIDIPTWIFHGNIDQYNPVEGSRNMYQLLQKKGSKVRYTEYDKVNHTPAFIKAWNEPDLLPWIFSQNRN